MNLWEPMKGRSVLLCGGDLFAADEEREAPARSQEANGDGEDRVKAFDCTHGNDMGGCWRHLFGAGGNYIDICQCKGAANFAEKRCLLLLGFNEGHVNRRSPDLNRNTGEAGAGSEVEKPVVGCWVWGIGREQMTSGEEGFAEVTGHNFFGIADGGEIDAGIPAN